MFRFRGAAPALKPEGALKRAEELVGVGQKQNALQTLHDTITNKRHQRNWNKAFEQVGAPVGGRLGPPQAAPGPGACAAPGHPSAVRPASGQTDAGRAQHYGTELMARSRVPMADCLIRRGPGPPPRPLLPPLRLRLRCLWLLLELRRVCASPAVPQAMLKYVDICVDMKAGRKCKDALINYRNACQQVRGRAPGICAASAAAVLLEQGVCSRMKEIKCGSQRRRAASLPLPGPAS